MRPENGTKKAAQTTETDTKKVVHATAKDTKKAADTTTKDTKKAAHATANGTQKAWDKTKSTTEGAVDGAKKGADKKSEQFDNGPDHVDSRTGFALFTSRETENSWNIFSSSDQNECNHSARSQKSAQNCSPARDVNSLVAVGRFQLLYGHPLRNQFVPTTCE